ncbi:MAG: gliding motility-associated C-terminal domain-containing protein [Bacteroidetes bacterium]|nr:gliding motility-associated C-terminal domain-containing protein [Bacteroidota bacterium]
MENIKFLTIFIFLLFFFSGKIFPQFSAGNNDTINPGVPVTLTASYGLVGNGVPSLPDLEDWVQGPFPIGFDFSFFGNKYSLFYIGANGWISFSPNPNSSGIRQPIAIPSAADYSPKNCILGPFQDLNPTMDGSPFIFYQTIGNAPKRKLVVMWCECPLYNCASSTVTFQIVLNEDNNSVENHIFHKPACPDHYGNKATLGLQNIDGYIGFSVPGYNATSWTADTMAWMYTPTSVDSFQVATVPYHFQPITPGNKISYRWYQGSEFLSDQQSFVVTPSQTTTYRAYCTLCSGEEFTDEITVYVVPYIPNAFTPNGDGLNDYFLILGLPPENITLYNIQIFNRWGQMVFSSDNILLSWDGTLKGEICPEGDYVWVIFYEDNKKTKTSNKGTVTLLR